MLHYIYSRSLVTIILLMAVWLAAWGILGAKIRRTRWLYANLLLFAASAAVILYATLLSRAEGDYGAVLRPFAKLFDARQQPELYREMLMNVFLFFPFGLTLSHVLPWKWHRFWRVMLTALAGCVLSAGIEYAQYRCALGLAETDDVLCNTLGAFLGAASLLIVHAIQKYRERSRQRKMLLTTTEVQFLKLIKAAFSGAEEAPADADWPAVFTLAAEQKLLPILFEAVCKLPAAGENAALFAAARQQVLGQVWHQTVRETAFVELYGRLRAANLHPIVVKGQLCGRLYPQKGCRISADDDLFVANGEFPACHELLLAHGLCTDTPADELAAADEITYTKAGSPLYVELHRHLFDSSGNAHDELNHFFADVRPVETGGVLAMPPHEHLLYLILHAYKHFVSRGIGLRQFADIGLWAQAYHEQIDWRLLYDQCAGVHAATFASAVFKIAGDCLGLEFALPAPWDTDIDVEPLLHDTLCGGIYGSNDYTRLHSSSVTQNAVKSSRKGKKSSVLRSVFPPCVDLKRRYPYLKKHPYLLPVAWAQRIVHYAGERRNSANNSASGSLRLARERIALMKQYDIIE